MCISAHSIHTPSIDIPLKIDIIIIIIIIIITDVGRLCGIVVIVPGYRSTSPGSIPGAIRFSEK
jgi:hypothetical protein